MIEHGGDGFQALLVQTDRPQRDELHFVARGLVQGPEALIERVRALWIGECRERNTEEVGQRAE
ncbi:Uncharacterised protein [Mycobacteroides abscessus subsp. abscessus]|nr:Uncharacterised protein [Mycobacteroides abscessus subsp. abscessus]